jgi:hypothetical protein
MTRNRRALGQTHLPLWAAGFVALACVAILALSGWREWSSRQIDLKIAEVDMANLARSLTQHADDTFQLADTILIGLVDRLETDGTGPAAIAKSRSFSRSANLPETVFGVFSFTTKPAAGWPPASAWTSRALTTATATTSSAIARRRILGP